MVKNGSKPKNVGNPIDFFNYKILQYLPNKRMRIAEKCRKVLDGYVLERIKTFLDNDYKTPSILGFIS